jgi:hypothetical protein
MRPDRRRALQRRNFGGAGFSKRERPRERRVLTGDNPAVVRIDDVEREAWRRFIQRVKVLAGE